MIDTFSAQNGEKPPLPPGPAAAKSPAAPKDAAPLSVLVVDDESLIRWSLKTGLTRRGHRVVEADCAAVALACIASGGSFDAVILDFRLPDRQDLSLLADVRRLLPAATVLMLTAYGDADMRSGALALGAFAVVDKPFQVNDVIALLETSAAH